MCGIAGLSLSRPVTRHDIDLMNNAMVHRGPDGDGVFVEEGIGIGMRRLSIIDLEGGWQPIANETGTIQVVHNGEIYNYQELRKELERLGHSFRTHSDTEVIVHAFEQWGGYEFATHLRGMFGIAILDREHKELWLIRDRLGIKPLFYANTDSGFAFASEIKCLLASGVVERSIDETTVGDYLAFGSADRDSSFVKGVKQLLPGHILRLKSHREFDIRCYWQYRTPTTRLQVSEEEAAEMVLDRLHESIRAHMIADVPVGAFLSGGVDSSAVVASMVMQSNAKLKTFSIGFEEAKFSELKYARIVAEKWGCNHHELIVKPDAVAIVEEVMDFFDEPFADASALPTWFVAKLASEHVRVVLSGDGGDELYAGYRRYQTVYDQQWLNHIPRVLRRSVSAVARQFPDLLPGKFFLSDFLGDDADRFAAEHSLFLPQHQEQLLRQEYCPQRQGRPSPTEKMRQYFRSIATGDLVADCMAFDIARYLPMDILPKVDRMTMAHRLEARPPLLDHQFVEFSASLPTSLKLKSSHDRKYILRKALSSLVPAEVMDRPKAGFSVPLQSWMAGPLVEMFQDSVLDRGHVLKYMHKERIQKLFVENRIGRRDHGLRLWAILVLELWLRKIQRLQFVSVPSLAHATF